MTNAAETNPLEIFVTYSGTVTAANFTTTDFSTTPSGIVPLSINQLAANAIRLQYGSSISAQTSLDYANGNPNVVTPDSVPIV